MATPEDPEPQPPVDQPPDVVRPDPSAHSLFLVGLGASAGGIQALREFFRVLPAQTGMAFVVVLHLSPEADSTLAQILQSVSPIPVQQVTEAVRVEPDHVYVIAPNKRLMMVDGWLRVEEMNNAQDRMIPIDRFFRTLAEAYRHHAACIVLSGAGADGKQGLKRVKEFGGLTLVQNPEEAEHASMPRNALETGVFDFVLPVREMPGKLVEYWETAQHLQVPLPPEGAEGEPPPTPDEAAAAAVRDVLALIRSRTGHDFSQYKRPTILRRIARRMQMNGYTQIPEYLEFLRSHANEVQALQRDLLISVTDFFRDHEAWQALEFHVIPKLFEGKGKGDQVRVWVAGCATGEEAYSLAILLTEYAERVNPAPTIQVFATDLDQEAIRYARDGLYEETIAADMSPERLRRFFTQEPDRYRVRKDLRERVLFAWHNILRDPPFSRLDLITCRNLLIYLNRDMQERVLETFHFAIRPEGYLFLGVSESADEPHNLFVPLHKKQRLFRRRTAPRVAPPLVGIGGVSTVFRPLQDQPTRTEERRVSFPTLYQQLLEQHAPPSVLVNREHEIVYTSEQASRYLRWAGGEPSHHLLRVVHPDLRLELHSALYAAVQEASPQTRVFRLEIDRTPRVIQVTVYPVSQPDYAAGYALITFLEVEEIFPDYRVRTDGGTEPVNRQLEEELERLRGEMRTTLEQYETTLEELRASNEELQAMNEELRSASEELETSKEELQSLNEELTTVNQELKTKVDEVSRANSDLQNLMASTNIGTVFLDRELRIKRYTPVARNLFNLIPGDTGRPLSDLAHQLEYSNLIDDAQAVLERLTMVEREVRGTGGRWFHARLLPYRSLEDRIEGVVLTFLDITGRHQAEQELHETQERFRLLVEGASDYAMFLLDPENRIAFWSAGAEKVIGFTKEEALGESGDLIFTPEDREAEVFQKEMEQALAEGRAEDRRWHVRKGGSRFWADGILTPLYNAAGHHTGFAKVLRDATREKEAADALQEAHAELEERVQERTAELEAANTALREEAEARQRAVQARQRLRLQLATAEEEERQRISRDLHDQLGQSLTGLILDLGRLHAREDLRPDMKAELERIQGVADELGRDMHRLAFELRPTALDDLGLAKAVANYLET